MNLGCSGSITSRDSLQWWLRRRGLKPERFCYAGVIRPDRTNKYILETGTDEYILTIKDLSVDDAGTYDCKWSKDDQISFVVTVDTETMKLTSTSATGKLSLFLFTTNMLKS